MVVNKGSNMARDKVESRPFVIHSRKFIKHLMDTNMASVGAIERVIGYSAGGRDAMVKSIGKKSSFKILVNYYNMYVKWCNNNNEVVNKEVKDYIDNLYK